MTDHLQQERTHTCGDLRKADVGQAVLLKGWVHRRRDHGGVIFIDLRDRYGLTQVVFRPENFPQAHALAEKVRSEYVLAVAGKVEARPEGMVNRELPTGEIDIIGEELEILAEAKTPPFTLEDDTDATEALKLKYRYLDLRRGALQKNLLMRHQLTRSMRTSLDAQGFIEVETPCLTKSTPEGSRDYLVPSRLRPGSFFALPQSPQLFKQLLMVSGFDRYYQIVRCFRDEDLRADRQPEFTQLDIEISFATPELIFRTMEKMFGEVFRQALQIETPKSFPRLSYAEAIKKYGSDKPDLRWAMPMPDLSHVLHETTFRVVKEVIAAGGEVRGLRLPGGGKLSRNQVDQLVKQAQHFGAKGLIWIREEAGKRASSVGKILKEGEIANLAQKLELKNGDLALLIADQANIARSALNSLRLHCIEKLSIPRLTDFAFTWIVDFPLFEYDEIENRYVSLHHPFTHPHPDDIEQLRNGENVNKVRALAYDLVLNGTEIGGGSIRIHRTDLQQLVFKRLGLNEETVQEKFGFLLEAFQYGAPPHGGIAFGLDRIAMIAAGTETIRDVIAFPKTQNAVDLMTDAPNRVSPAQLKELSLNLVRPKK